MANKLFLFDACLRFDGERFFLRGEVDGRGLTDVYPVEGSCGGRFRTADGTEGVVRSAEGGAFDLRAQEIMRWEWGLDGLPEARFAPEKAGTESVPLVNGWHLFQKDGRWRLTGNAYGHPWAGQKGLEEGFFIRTSEVCGIEGRVATTRSGSRYYLGEPSPIAEKHLSELGKVFGVNLDRSVSRSMVFDGNNGYNGNSMAMAGLSDEEFERLQQKFFAAAKDGGGHLRIADERGRLWECEGGLNGSRPALARIQRVYERSEETTHKRNTTEPPPRDFRVLPAENRKGWHV